MYSLPSVLSFTKLLDLDRTEDRELKRFRLKKQIPIDSPGHMHSPNSVNALFRDGVRGARPQSALK